MLLCWAMPKTLKITDLRNELGSGKDQQKCVAFPQVNSPTNFGVYAIFSALTVVVIRIPVCKNRER